MVEFGFFGVPCAMAVPKKDIYLRRHGDIYYPTVCFRATFYDIATTEITEEGLAFSDGWPEYELTAMTG
jgi:hypothetical protein